ncbi:MAG: glycosyltransferase [Chitinispirillales bacterium]|jgi:glycosyltransferase involved in cell wall biosynthesis|nr:glycosyltransferase [Chitinispirillales bacterium]
MEKISIIIPIYNVEPYIKKCIDSVINQTYKNLEIFLINDGSTDNSGKICDEYAGNDSRIRVFHKENGGINSARNAALKNLTGDFIGSVDPDDWIEPDMYETLYKVLKEKNTKISISSYYIDFDTESFPIVNKKKIPDGVIPQRDMPLYPLKRDYYKGFAGYIWNKLYSADIIKSRRLFFDENNRYAADVLFNTSLFLTPGCTGVYIDKPLYHYYQRATATTKSKSLDLKKDILVVYKKVEKLLNDNGYNNESYWARGFYCHHAGIIAKIAAEQKNVEILEQMRNEIRLYIDDYIKTNEEFPEKFERMCKLLDLEAAECEPVPLI